MSNTTTNPPFVIAVTNNKGGVGKTTSTLNIAKCLTDATNTKAIIIDFDGQNDTVTFFNLSQNELPDSVLELLTTKHRTDPMNFVYNLKYENLGLIVGDKAIKTLDSELSNIFSETDILEKYSQNKMLFMADRINFIIRNLKVDYVFVNMHPEITDFSSAILANTDLVIAPVLPDKLSVKNMIELFSVLESLTDTNNEDESVSNTAYGYVFVNSFDRRYVIENGYRGMIEKYINDTFGKKFYLGEIPKSTKVDQALHEGRVMNDYAPRHKVTKAYEKLTKQLIKIIREVKKASEGE